MAPVNASLVAPAFRLGSLFIILGLMVCTGCATRRVSAPVKPDPESQLKIFAIEGETLRPGSDIEIYVFRQHSGQPVEGAVVLLSGRDHQGANFGRVTNEAGKCRLHTTAGAYTLNVQYTGLKQFSQRDFVFQSGKSYRLEIEMVSFWEEAKGGNQGPSRQIVTGNAAVAAEEGN